MTYAREGGSGLSRCSKFLAGVAAGILTAGHVVPAGAVELASLRDGAAVAAGGREPALSKDARYVAFLSWSGGVVPGDTSSNSDVFVRDRETGRTEWITVAYDGSEPDCDSNAASISADGRYVAFASCATNLVRGQPTTWGWRVFVRDRVARTTSLVAAGYDPRISGGGNSVAFLSTPVNRPGDTCGIDCPDVFVADLVSGQIEPISIVGAGLSANAGSYLPSLSWGGRYVVYYSVATDLVPGDTNGVPDIFLHDRETGLTERVNLSSADAQANGAATYGRPSVSNDGRYVAFNTAASNLVPGDDPFSIDTFVRDRWAGVTERISVTTSGVPLKVVGNTSPAISATGRFVAFESTGGDANQHNDVYLRDRVSGKTVRASVGGNRPAQHAAISGNGRFVAYDTAATNLDARDTNVTNDVYLYRRP